jgi:oxygen-dependent protoporphyrinogen oxidase
VRVDGFQVEVGASLFPDSKRSTLDLCRQIGLSDELLAVRPQAKNRYIAWKGGLHLLPGGPVQFLQSGLLSWHAKLRLLCERWVRARSGDQHESVHQFACRRIGREAADVLIDAMVTGIHAGDAELLSVAAAFPRMVQLERAHGSLFRALSAARRRRLADARSARDSASPSLQPPASTGFGGVSWSLKRGMGQIIEQLADDPNFTLVRAAAVRRVQLNSDGRWTVAAEGHDAWPADAVVLACPSFAQAAITESLDSALARLLGEIPYNSVTVVALGFRKSDIVRSLDGFGYLIPQRTRRDVLGVLWTSSIFDGRAPADMVLMQAMCGGWNRPDIVAWDDDRLLRAVLQELRQTMSLQARPCFVHIARWPQAIPQYHVGHLDRVKAIEAQRRQWPGLYLTGNSFRGISVNDCTEEAVRCADEVVEKLK